MIRFSSKEHLTYMNIFLMILSSF